MKCTPRLDRKLACIAFALAGLLAAAVPAHAGPLTIANEPLGAPAGLILPNIMFILDDSGSMDSDYMPDYVNDSNNFPSSASDTTFTSAACADAGDDSVGATTGPPAFPAQTLGRLTGAPKTCVFGDPPYNSPDFNEIYYNPGVFYQPGVNAPDVVTGVMTDKTNMDKANTSSWTQVPVHPYTSATIKDLVTGANVTVMNLAGGYPDRVWCTNKADVANSGNCRQNSAYQFPDSAFPYGENTSNNLKYIGVSPYYYRMQTAQYCANKDVSTGALTTCVSGSSVVPGTHKYQAPEYCTDAALINCAAGAAVTAAHIYSGPRWCADVGTLVDCRKKKGAVPVTPATSPVTYKHYIYAKHLGATKSQDCTVASPCPAQRNQGNILVNAVNPPGGTITAITIAGISVIPGPIAVPANSTPDQVAALIAPAIHNYASTPKYTASASGNNVTIERANAGVSGAGDTISVFSNAVGTQSSIGSIVLSTGSGTAVQDMTVLSVNGVNLLCPIAADQSFLNGVTAKAPDGRIVAATGTSTTAKRTSFRDAIVSRINACTGVNGSYTATLPTSTRINIVAPLSQGASPNGQAVARSGTTGSLSNFAVNPMGSVQPGTSSGDVSSVVAMTGGQDAVSDGTTRDVRVGVGAFSRIDIVSSIDSYPKGAKRSDCAGATCTYAEEMTNFANWFTYYRTRMQMMKTAVGRAFIPIDTNYRVGFITICPVSTDCTSNGNTLNLDVVSAKYLKIADFSAAHKNAWYTKLYDQTPAGSTPLREALSRVGTMYAGRFGSGLTKGLTAADDPVTRSCQPNFALLSTDGYWNGGQGYKEDGTTPIGNQDNVNTGPYSLQTQGVFDGGTPTASNTLADVALYYYKTDLRTSGILSQNNVPTTNKDIASHQHMVTFTLGLGLDGELTYRSDYEAATSGDFFDIKQGVKKWPVPAADTPTALDDLWHTAVNGRGVFYSIKNPAELAASLGDMADQLEARLGAGAAAATSNLQPVAGDNFAFTASFTTSAWTGDLKARTIDLSTGVVSTASLWSAAALLDVTPYTSRQIYTYDPSDTIVGGGQNGNRLKHFCPPGAGGAACSDGLGLTPSPGGEMDFFATTQLPQSFDLAQQASATSASLVNYLRGDRSFESTTPLRLLGTDLYRARESLMGDVVNSQPVYVKRSPFSYSDSGYLAFRACTEGIGTGCTAAQFPTPFLPRLGTVYSAGNDGMLHAFETDKFNNPYYQTAGISTASAADDAFTGDNTGNGVERWAYIPSLVLPKLYKLASEPYSHSYSTDGTPQSGDICISTPCAGLADWRTILVGGLNSGGVGYYALDITNPVAPKALWELSHGPCLSVDGNGVPTPAGTYRSDCHLGLSYGNAIITKRFHDQRWVVIVTSGYNNTVGTAPNKGDGKGYLYVLDAVTGNILHRVSTGVGTPDVDLLAVPPRRGPSGLSKINGWTTNGSVDNTALAVYGGDLEGNLWRFKLDFAAGTGPGVTRITTVKDAAGVAQPITVKPELADVNGERVIVFGTGKFLEVNDKVPPETTDVPPLPLPFQTQTIYALRDNLSVTGAGPVFPAEVRLTPEVKAMELTAIAGTDNRTAGPAAAGALPNLAVDLGWRLDLPENGERINVDPVLQLGTLVIASNVPTTDTCAAGGFSFINFLDVTTGSFVPGSANNLASTRIASSILVGVNVIMLPGGAVKTIGTLADETRRSEDTPVPPVAFVGKRVSWRELFIDQ